METFGYDILKKDSVGAPIWLEAVRDLDTAKKRVAELAENSPGEYVVFCERTSQIVDSLRLRLISSGLVLFTASGFPPL